jgi:hypothetical protein
MNEKKNEAVAFVQTLPGTLAMDEKAAASFDACVDKFAEMNPHVRNEIMEAARQIKTNGFKNQGFQVALSALKDGYKVRRAHWKEGAYLRISREGERPWNEARVILECGPKTPVADRRWHCDTSELLEEDWCVLQKSEGE